MNNQNDPLALFRINKQGIPQTLTPPDPLQMESDDPLNVYRIKKPEEKHAYNVKDFARVPAGLSARGIETLIGAPEETKRGFGGLLDLVIGGSTEYISGEKNPKLREFLRDPLSSLGEHRETAEELERKSLSPGESSIFTKMPTSEEVKEQFTKPLSKSLTGEENVLEPKSEPERFAQEFTQDLVRLAIPGSGVNSWLGRIGLSIGGNSAKEISKQLGFSPSTQELVKMGTLGILSLAQLGNAPQFARQHFQQTKAAMPRGVRINTTPLQTALNRIRRTDWFRGHNVPETRAAREMIQSIEERIQGGTIPIHDAMTLRENLNSMAESLGAFNVERGQRTAHVARLNEVRDALIQGMEQTVGRQYPQWWNQYQQANQAFGITQRSTALGNFIANNYARPIVSDAGKILFGNALAKGAAGVAKLGIATAGIASGAKAITLVNRMRSPLLRRYYGQVLNCAARGDSIAMANALRKFDEESLKEEKKEKIINNLRNPFRK
jgi:hypothetical protein